MSLTYDGAGVKCQEYKDGWIYELYAPIGADQSVIPRAKTAKLLFEGRWIAAWEEDEINYMTVWVPRKVHEDLFPKGPPATRFYDQNATRAATGEYPWLGDPNDTNPSLKTGELKLVELARLIQGEEGATGN